MSTALAMRGPGTLCSPAGAGFGTAVQTLEGCVSAFFALDDYDRRDGVASYALRVVNRTRSALVCRTWVISRSGDAMLAHPIMIEVAPLSTTVTHVPVWPGDFGSFERAIAEIAGDGVHCIVEAPAPVRRKAQHLLAILCAASVSAATVALVAAMTLRALLPPLTPIRYAPSLHASARAHGSAQIESISVNPAVAKPGESVSVAYAAMGDGGYVQLVGTDGAIWQQRPFSRQGQAAFVIPPVSSSREMRVLVHVTRGRTAAQSMAGLVVASQTPATQTVTGQVVGDDQPNAPATAGSDANGTFELRDSTVKSGGSIHVRILSPRNEMRLSLTDGQSHELATADVGADATDVTLRAPVVYVPTRYTVVATFTDGFGQEAVVAPITVTP
jgi:hypothetical protein